VFLAGFFVSIEGLTMSEAHRRTGTDPHDPSTPETTSRTQGEAQHPPALGTLSNWQTVITVMAANGRTNHQISLRLKIPVPTVERYLEEAMDILRLPTQQDLTHPVINAHLSRTNPVPGPGSTHRDNTPGTNTPTQPEAPELTPRTRELDPMPEATTPVPMWLSRVDGQFKDAPDANSLVAMDATEAVRDAAEALQALVRTSDEDADDDPHQDAALGREVAAAFELLQHQRETVENVGKAVRSRDVIGQAKGILMERHKISSDAALAILQDESARADLEIADLAAQVIRGD
jgi:DNA-binding CsgD family transcriptional regulator